MYQNCEGKLNFFLRRDSNKIIKHFFPQIKYLKKLFVKIQDALNPMRKITFH